MSLENDSKLREKWDDDMLTEIPERLTSKANGMFRWVECQLDVLRECYTIRELREALKSLPSTLDETYKRILLRIPKKHARHAIVVFNLLSCAFRPVTLKEATEIVAVNLASDSFDAQDRLNDPSDILSICSTLLMSSLPIHATFNSQTYLFRDRDMSFSHFSVKEYLESGRAPSPFRITPDDAHAMVARISLTFLLSVEYRNPFYRYAVGNCMHHTQKLNQQMFLDFERRFEESNLERFKSWMFSNDNHIFPSHFGRQKFSVPTVDDRLFYASLIGFPSICRMLIANGANVNKAVGLRPGALTGACFGGHKAVVELLLDNGADPDPDPGHRNDTAPLVAAYSCGNVEIVRLLLAKVVDVDLQRLTWTLPGVAGLGIVEVVQLLLDRGVEVNYQNERGDTPLGLAVNSGHEQVVRLLLMHDADVNPPGRSNPLEAAVFSGDEKIVQLLLQHGADINRRSSRWDNVLEAAVDSATPEVIGLLLAHVSSSDVESGCYDRPFEKTRTKSVIRLFEAAGFVKPPVDPELQELMDLLEPI